MTKKTRLIILLACVACFLVVAPVLVLYSMGYRFDFNHMKITEIGGIYVRTSPIADQIIIDSKILEKPGVFSNNAVYVQNLFPGLHSVLVEKSGYYDYSKIISVQEKQVTKLEDIILFKKNIKFETASDKTPSPFAVKKPASPITKAVAFATQNNIIIWLSTDGFIYKSDLTNLTSAPLRLTLTPIKIVKTGVYKIITNANNIFVNNNTNLLLLNSKTSELETFYAPVADAKISSNGRNIVFYNSNNVYITPLNQVPFTKTSLYKSSEKITDCEWLNNNYIIFTTKSKIIFSEIDGVPFGSGNINTVALPQPADKIFFNQQEGKLYVLTGKTLLVSERIVP